MPQAVYEERRYAGLKFGSFEKFGITVRDYEKVISNGNTNLFLPHGKQLRVLNKDSVCAFTDTLLNLVVAFPQGFDVYDIERCFRRYRYLREASEEQLNFVFVVQTDTPQRFVDQHISFCKNRYAPVITPYLWTYCEPPLSNRNYFQFYDRYARGFEI